MTDSFSIFGKWVLSVVSCSMHGGGLVGCLLALGLAVVSCRRERHEQSPKAVAVRADGAIALTVMSFNVRYEEPRDRGARAWSQRVIPAVRMIRRERPDVFGVQEALHGQVADLWASLPEYQFLGVGRSDGRTTGEYTGIFYDRHRFLADSQDGGTFWLSDFPSTPGSRTWGNEIPRVAIWIRLTDRATGRGFYVFNTHWDHRNQPSRERSALLLAERIDGRLHPDEPVVLLGDFNSTETNRAVNYLTGKKGQVAGKERTWSGGLLDAYQQLHAGERNRSTLHLWRNRREGQLKVDHILVSPGARVEQAAIVTGDAPMISDHFPVTARIVFPLK
jgi:endonuclease/exonuclease/phosphatase family metal-dependent hydrolase